MSVSPTTAGATMPAAAATTATVTQPSVTRTSPAAGSTNVLLNTAITCDLSLPNGAVDPATMTSANVTLVQSGTGTAVACDVKTTGGGDAIICTPSAALAANTAFTFTVTSGVKDAAGVAFTPFVTTFTTGAASSGGSATIRFQKVALTNVPAKNYTCVTMGPDGMLYAASDDGLIYRFPLNADGTLAAPQTIGTIQTYEGGQRLVVGLEFDPAGTAASPVLWVTNTAYGTSVNLNEPDWSGKITRLSGTNLSVAQDYVVGLPRSVKDHVTNQLHFGPDGALYVSQAADNAFGASDTTWGNRPEHLLNAAILRVDTKAIAGQLAAGGGPVNVQTEASSTYSGPLYNPFASGAPVTIWADGVRNAYDFVFAANGKMYAPVNGSSSGGNSPATPSPFQSGPRIDSATSGPYAGPAVPGLTNIQETEDDYLDQIVQGGYYGHPDPARTEYVLDGGNPTGVANPAAGVFTEYPVGTLPDRNYRKPLFDIGTHQSADGIIQYQGRAFGGALNGALMVTRYSAGDDVEILKLAADGTVSGTITNVTGLTGFTGPVDLVENPATGYLYVAEYGGTKLTLVKPVDPEISLDKARLLFNGVRGATPGAAQTVTVTNAGTSTLNIAAGAVTLTGADAAQFTLVNPTTAAIALAPGTSTSFQVKFSPAATTAAGLKTASLQILSDDAANPTTTAALRALATTGTGGANEPSLQSLFNLFQIPDNDGDFNPATTDFNSAAEPIQSPNDEVSMNRLVKAGAGPVTVTPLAVFANSTTPPARFGWYAAAQADSKSQLLTFASADAQSVNPAPLGSTQFDPGSGAFGVYAEWPTFQSADGSARTSYSEDALNGWDTASPRKVRFYPLKNPDGSVVANAFVMAFEDYNLAFDSNDIVAVIRNVKAAPSGPVLGLTNPDGLPFSDRLLFNRIANLNATTPDALHDTDTLKITNTGDQPLVISALSLSNTAWQLVNPPAAGTTVPANGGMLSVTIKFVATTVPTIPYAENNEAYNGNLAGLYNGTLTISSNATNSPVKTVQLAGYFQTTTENGEEPSLQTTVNLAAGYQTLINPTPTPHLTESTGVTYYGEEIVSPYWSAADPSQPVHVQQLSSWHSQGNSVRLWWFPQGSPATQNLLWVTLQNAGQEFFPLSYGANNTTVASAASFNPAAGATFGWQIDAEYSDDALNTTTGGGGHHVRFFPVRDRSGNLVPNAVLMAMDYGGSTTNQDFNDNVFLITNVRPAARPAAPADFTAVAQPAGGVALQWGPNPESNVTGYNVYRATSAAGTFTKLNAVPLATTSYVDLTAAAGATFYYHLTAVNSAGAESLSAGATAAAAAATGGLALSASAGTGAAAGQITLTWTAVSGATAYAVQRSPDGVSGWAQVAAPAAGVTTYADTGLSSATTYFYRVTATVSGVVSAPSNVASATTATVNTLPSPWVSADVGMVGLAGSAGYSAGRFTVAGSGADIYNTADGFRYVYQPLTGDGQVVARVTALQQTSPYAKAGVMVRETLAAGSAQAMMELLASGGVEFEYRAATGATTGFAPPAGTAAPPYWVKLVRSGSTLTGSVSADGVTWAVVGTATIPMAANVYVGLAVTAHDNTQLNTSAFDNVSVGPLAAGSGPTIATPAAASPAAVAGATAALSVLGADPAGEAGLAYTWAATSSPAAPAFGANGTNAAKSTTVTFASAGSYVFTVTARDAAGLTATSSVTVTVSQTATSVRVTPGAVTLPAGATQTFAASELDQFGNAMATQPAFTWSVDAGGIGSVTTAGVYAAPASGSGAATVRATATGAALTGTSAVTVAAAFSGLFIDAGGTAAGSFVADTDFTGTSTPFTNAVTIDTTSMANPPPQPVFQTERYGKTFGYSIPGLTPGASYNVRSDFCENWWTAAGQRSFNVAINGTAVLTSFDIYAAAGGRNKGIARTFTAVADSAGTVTISFTTNVDNAVVNGIEVTPAASTAPAAPAGLAATSGAGQVGLTWAATSGATRYNVYRSTAAGQEGATPWRTGLTSASFTDASVTAGTRYYYQVTAANAAGEGGKSAEVSAAPTALASALINAGGPASGSFSADAYFTGGTAALNTFTASTPIDTTGVTSPAPQSVYQSERYGNSFSYAVTGLTPGAGYSVRLDFAEFYWTQAGQRVFNVAINGLSVLSDFDIIKAAGGAGKAVAETFTATADASGRITIAFTTVTDNAKVSGIEITPAP